MRQPDTMQAPTPPLPVTRLDGSSLPTVTILVLTCNRGKVVRQTVASLKAVNDGWSIVAVDNGSTERTADALAAEHPGTVGRRAPPSGSGRAGTRRRQRNGERLA